MYRAFIFLTFITLFGTAFRPIFLPSFDSVIGTWKRTTMTMIDASGKTTDLAQSMQRSMPCTKDITYTFSGDGQLKSSVPESCGAIKKAVESMNASAHWSITGRKLTVTTTMKEFSTTTYDVSFQGNTMTWLFIFADNPKTPSPANDDCISAGLVPLIIFVPAGLNLIIIAPSQTRETILATAQWRT